MSALWDYMSKEHGLTLLGSDIDDILALARQEIELPDISEIREKSKDWSTIQLQNAFNAGADYALMKVRNPYPKPM